MAEFVFHSRVSNTMIQPFIFLDEGAYPSLRHEKQSEWGLEDLNCPWVRGKKTLLNNRLQFPYCTSPLFKWSGKWQGNCLSPWILPVLLSWNLGPCFNFYNIGRRNEVLFSCHFPMSSSLKRVGCSYPVIVMPDPSTAILLWACWAILSKLHSKSWLHLELGLTSALLATFQPRELCSACQNPHAVSVQNKLSLIHLLIRLCPLLLNTCHILPWRWLNSNAVKTIPVFTVHKVL